jgi:hypothetical protein
VSGLPRHPANPHSPTAPGQPHHPSLLPASPANNPAGSLAPRGTRPRVDISAELPTGPSAVRPSGLDADDPVAFHEDSGTLVEEPSESRRHPTFPGTPTGIRWDGRLQ